MTEPTPPPCSSLPDELNQEGAELLDRVRAVLDRYVILPSDETADAVTLWIAATHAQLAWAHAARLVIRAPEKRCGKSRLLDVAEALCHDPLITVNGSPAAVYRSIGVADPPTLLIDEADTLFGRKTAESNEDLRGLLNAGHQRNRPAIRYDAATRKVERISTFAMAALAGIGRMPDTIEDRAVVVRMRRRAPGEYVDPYRHRRDSPALRELAEELREWLRGNLPVLESAEPDMPIEDRAADTWEPLIAVADLAGGDWPKRSRHAAEVLTEEQEESDPDSPTTRLLTDCRTAFGDDRCLSTEDLLAKLKADQEAPWADWGTSGLTPRRLAAMLGDFGIKSGNIRFTDGLQRKGYEKAHFLDVWNRYCPTQDQRRETNEFLSLLDDADGAS